MTIYRTYFNRASNRLGNTIEGEILEVMLITRGNLKSVKCYENKYY